MRRWTLGLHKVVSKTSAVRWQSVNRTPLVSVIIPTFNRCNSVRRILDALAKQTFDLAQVEVLVVPDGSSDGTETMLQNYAAPFELRIIAQTNQGAATARNNGA